MHNALMIMGTRPEIIKLGPVYRALSAHDRCTVSTFWTGQHIELAEGLLELFDIDVTHRADDVMQRRGLAEKTGQMLKALEAIGKDRSYDSIIVQGDTLSAMAGAIFGFLARIPVAHVEAGLRTHNLESPWPEEFARRVISVGTRWHFAPTLVAKENLLKESVPERDIVVTGNTVVDALQFVHQKVCNGYLPHNPHIRSLPSDKKLILVTGHRRENFGPPLRRVLSALRQLASDGDKHLVFPVHLNPSVRREVMAHLDNAEGIQLLEPLRYPDFIYLLGQSWTVITDSGGLQEEVPTFHIPVVITRDTTERPEVIDAGFGHLVGCDDELIVSRVRQLTQGVTRTFIPGANPFGNGEAAVRIVEALEASSVDVAKSWALATDRRHLEPVEYSRDLSSTGTVRELLPQRQEEPPASF